jgi:hypothetical protein
VRKLLLLLIVLAGLYPEMAAADFWRKAVAVAAAPGAALQATVAKAAVQKITGNNHLANAVGSVINPSSIVVNHAVPVAHAIEINLAQYVTAAVNSHDPIALLNLPNAWFIQSVLAIKGMEAVGIIRSHEDCLKAARLIGKGVATGAAAELGSMDVGEFTGRLTTEFEEAACNVADRQRLSPAQFRQRITNVISTALHAANSDVAGLGDIYNTGFFDLPMPNTLAQVASVEKFLDEVQTGRFPAPMAICVSRSTGVMGFLMPDLRSIIPDLPPPGSSNPVLRVSQFVPDPTGTFVYASNEPGTPPLAIDKDGWLVSPPTGGNKPLLVGSCKFLDITLGN